MPAQRFGYLFPIAKFDRSDGVLTGVGVAGAGLGVAAVGQSRRTQRLSGVREASDRESMARRAQRDIKPQRAAEAAAYQVKYDEMMNIRTPKGYKPRGQTFISDAARVLARRDLAQRAVRDIDERVSQRSAETKSARGKMKAPTRLRNAGLLAAGAGVAGSAALAHSIERKRQEKKQAVAPKPLRDYRRMAHDGIPANISPSAGRDWLKANKDRA
jgi:hypothetical protein